MDDTSNYDRSPKKKRTRSDWQALNTEWEQSGQTQEAFCKERALSVGTLTYWRSLIKRGKTHRSKSKEKVQSNDRKIKFFSASISAPQCETNKMYADGLVLKMPNGMALEISPNANERLLETVIHLLRVSR